MSLFKEPMLIKDQEFFVSASGGVSVYPVDGTDIDTLIKNADLALHSAKESGKKHFTFCTPAMKRDVEHKTQLTNYLYRAQERNELILYYQPQVNVTTKKIIGAEALIRWQHPEKGLIFPSVFIPLTEQTGLINPIGQWALETACSQAKAWQNQGLPPVTMAVNLSVEQFRNPYLKDMIARTLERTGLAANYLELEITENIAIKEPDDIIRVLNDLKDLGVSISIDDFGTEYSSLSRLKQLPIDRIKIAMQFVHGISSSSKDEAITKVIINLARNLGLRVIAEGVETETQLNFLSERLCDEIQGYYFYKPMTAAEFEAALRKEKRGNVS
jgi:EAL domain-containing protein (putative c-di-GMP-specific phosphodiesterase class I)